MDEYILHEEYYKSKVEKTGRSHWQYTDRDHVQT